MLLDELTRIAARIIKIEKLEDGSLIVKGAATTSDEDLDRQIIDPAFAAKAMPAWFEWGNVRQMHSTGLAPAGKAISLNATDEGHFIEAKVVEPGAIKLCEEGVYQAFSVGIANARVIRDNTAKGGRIVDGTIVEVSLVDYPANPKCKFMVAKRAGNAESDEFELVEKAVDVEPADDPPAQPIALRPYVTKRGYTDEQRTLAATNGQALPDGTFTIIDRDDIPVALAYLTIGTDEPAAQPHIVKRAQELDALDLLPGDWTTPSPEVLETVAFIQKRKAIAPNFMQKRMHDYVCASYDTAALKEVYPTLVKDGVALTLGPQAMQLIWQMLQAEIAEDAGSGEELYEIRELISIFEDLRWFVQDEYFDEIYSTDAMSNVFLSARDGLHEGFKSAQAAGVELPSPTIAGDVTPGMFSRPASHTVQASARIPDQTHVAEGSDFQRGPLTDGHQLPTAEKMTAAIMHVHDAVTKLFPSMCPMTVKMDGLMFVTPPTPTPLPVKAEAKPTPIDVPESARKAPGEKAADVDITSLIEASVTKAVEAASAEWKTERTRLIARLDALAAEPDPLQDAPRGAIGITKAGEANKVSASDIAADEAQKRATAEADAKKSATIAELRIQERSSDPEMREHATRRIKALTAEPVGAT